MDLRNWEMFAGTAAPVVGADVTVYEAELDHPNPNSALDTTTTDGNGMWEFTGLTDAAKDVKVEYADRVKWYKGLTLHSVYAVRESAEDTLADQNLLTNGGFEVDTTGAASFSPGTSYGAIVDGWRAKRGVGDTATLARVTTPVSPNSQYALEATYTKSAGNLQIAFALPAALVYALRGKTVSASAQVRQSVASGIAAGITDGVGSSTGTSSVTTGAFFTSEVLNHTIDLTATAVDVYVIISASGIYRVDNVMLNLGTTALVFHPRYSDFQQEASVTIAEAAPTKDTNTLAVTLNNLAERVRGIIGAAGNDWKDAIPRTLTQLLADVNTKVAKAGDTMSGDLSISANTAGALLTLYQQNAAGFSVAIYNAAQAAFDVFLDHNSLSLGVPTTSTAAITGTTLNGTADVQIGGTSVKARAIHTGTQLAATISDFATAALAATAAAYAAAAHNHDASYSASGHSHAAGDATTLDGIDSTGFLKIAQGGGNQTITFTSGSIVVGQNALGAGDGMKINGSLNVTGVKTRLATGTDGTEGYFHALETPSPYFEDFGRARLYRDRANVPLPLDYANFVQCSDYHVYLTPEDPAVLYVSERHPGYFVVELLSGVIDARFSWRLVARQGDLLGIARLGGPKSN